MIKQRGVNIFDLMNPAEIVNKTANKAKYLSNKVSLDDVIETADISKIFLPNSKKIETGIILTNNAIKDFIKI